MDCSALASFHQVKIKNGSILVEILFMSIVPRFDTYLHPSKRSLHGLQSFLKSPFMIMNSYDLSF